MAWRVRTLNATVDRELDALPADMRARFVRIARLIATGGLERVGMLHVRHLTGQLWEMRLGGRDGSRGRCMLPRRTSRSWWCGRLSRKPGAHRNGKSCWRCDAPRRYRNEHT